MKHTLLLIFFIIAIPIFSQNKDQSIGFKENKGQIIDQKGKPNNAVKYLLNSGGLNVQLRKNGFSYDVYEAKKHPINHSQYEKKKPLPFPSKDNDKLPDYTLEYQYHRIDIDFVNSNPEVELITEEKSLDYDNYYNIPNKPEGVLMVHQYKQITYKNIYPNIDVVFSIPKDTLKTVEYNFVVHPKGKISDIQLKFSGAQTELVDNKIRMSVRFGEMEETLPASWTEGGELKKEIAVGYTKIKKNVYGFESSENVSDKTVIIDPVPVRLWGTFYGDERNIHYSLGSVNVTTDSSGNAYMTGTTTASNSSYATTGAHQTSIPSYFYGSSNGIIVKFSPNGNRLWGTYFGGQGINMIKDIKIDYQNNVVIVGHTPSQTNISTIGSYKPNLTDDDDAFLVKFNNSGLRLWGTYFGGETSDSANALSIDKNNNIYIVGVTLSKTNIAVNSNFQTQLNDGYYRNDGFLSKFTADGNLTWSTYVGGDGRDELKAIVVKDNYLITGGDSESFNKITTAGVFQENHDSNNHSDCVVYKFSLDGQRIWATYYGGEQVDYLYTVETDDEDNVYLGGQTGSFNNITTPGSFDSINQYLYDGFFAKLNSKGERVWGTYLGSANVYSLIFKNNSIYIGATDSHTYHIKLTTPCSYRPIAAGSEGYIGKFSKEGNLIWGTYIGGSSSTNENTKITFDDENNIFVSGASSQNNGIADSSSYQSSILGSFSNYFLMKFSEDNIFSPKISSNSPICIGNSLELKASGGTNYLWAGPNGFTSIDQNPIIPNTTAINSGEYSCLITGTVGCDDTKKINVVIGDIQSPIPNLSTLPSITGDCHTSITAIPTATDACAGIITATTASPLSYSLPGTYTVIWDYDDGNGNISHQNQTVTISSQPLPTATSPQTFCIQQNASLNDITITTGQNIKWYDQLTAGNLLLNTALLEDNKTYYASQTINGCESERAAIDIKIQDTPAPTGDVKQTFCSDQNPTIADITVTGQDIKWYDATPNGNILLSSVSLQNGRTYYASQTLNSCEGERLAVMISIQNTPGVPTGDTNPKFCKSENATFNNINIAGENLKWYDSNTSDNTLANNTLVQNNTTYYVSQTIGCESDRLVVLVNVYDTPLPIANASKTFCIDENATLDNITVSGQNLKWYDAPSPDNVLANTTILENKTYYVTQTNNNCESEKLLVVIKIQDTQPPIGDTNQSFCIQENATINTIKINGQDIKWYNAETNGTNLSESTPLENGITYYATQTINDCESQSSPITVQIQQATTADCINFVDELPFPKFFTPNNDGHNDNWTIEFAYLAPNTGIKIFDRYGKLIKILNINQVWDGTFNGYNLPSSDYWFVVTRLNGAEFKSHFSLKR